MTDTRAYDAWSALPNVERRTADRQKLDNSKRPRQQYADRLKEMDLPALKKETESKIWLSAYAANNPRSDYHWHCDYCYDELMERTQSDEVYAACWKRVAEQ